MIKYTYLPALLLVSSTCTLLADETINLKPELVLAPAVKKAVKHAYAPTTATSASKMDLRLLDTPQTVDVRNEQIIKDIGGLQRSDDVAKTVPGVSKSWNGNGGSNTPLLNFRGFSNTNGFISSDFLKDGYRKLSAAYTTIDLANIERIEFLKGPSSLLYGSTKSLGGTANFISKRPQPSPSQRMDFTLGSYDSYRTTLDVGTALNQQKSALLRFNAAIEDAASFRDYANHQTQFFAPAFSYEFDNGDKFTALIDYTNTTMVHDSGIPITPLYAKIPRTTYYQNPSTDHIQLSALNTLFEFKHNFDGNWKLTTGISTSWNESNQRYTRFFNFPAFGPYTVLNDPSSENVRKTDMNAEVMLEGHIRFADMDHHLLWGMGYIKNNSDSTNISGGNLASFYITDLLHPDYSHVVNWAAIPVGYGKTSTETYTVYAQDLITIIPKVKIILGLRYDHMHNDTEFQNFYGYSPNTRWSNSQTDTGPVLGFSPRWGIIYQPTENSSLYTSYTTSFQQQINFFSTPGNHFIPETGEQYEVGFKQALSYRLSFTMALFELSRNNVLFADLNKINRTGRQIRQQQSRGIELSLLGNISDNIRLTGAYTWLKAEISKDDVFKVNAERPGIPNHMLNLFAVYSFSGVLSGFELGTGVNYNSSVQASIPNTFKLPDSIQWDALVAYRINKHFKIQANIRNLTDHRNYSVSPDYGYITFGEPRSAYVTFSAEY